MFETLKKFITHEPTQREQAPNTVPNSAGGYSFKVADWTQFERFLILGTTGGTYYINESKLTKDNVEAVKRCIDADGLRAVQMIVEISDKGRAPKNDPAIFALALCSAADNPDVRAAALAALPKVCRTFTHLSHFMSFVRGGKLRGFGRAFVRAIANWYNDRPVHDLVNQVIKYGARDGYSHRDVYRLAHPARFLTLQPLDARRQVYNYIAKGTLPTITDEAVQHLAHAQSNFEEANDTAALCRLTAAYNVQHNNFEDSEHLLTLIRYNKLPMEVVPTDKRTPMVYKTVAAHAGLTWIIRNLANMTRHGCFEDKAVRDFVCHRITNKEHLKNARVHPLNIFFAMHTYKSGKSERGSSTWNPHRDLLDALDEAFYESFNYVEPSGKRFLFAVDSSGSMTGAKVMNTSVPVHQAAAVMAMAAAKAESEFHLIAFDTDPYRLDNISHRQRLDDVVRAFTLGGGGTDCSIPMRYARQQQWDIDCFVIFTDSETWAGNKHPHRVLADYRASMGKPKAKAINIAMAANPYSTFDGSDPLAMQIVGFDSSIPEIISTFAKG